MAGPAPVGMVHDVPDADVSTSQPPHRPHRQVDAVLFDFQGTLAQVEDPVDWVIAAAAACGAELDRAKATALADRLVTAGRAGGPPPHRVPPHLAEVWADRDLYEWLPYADTEPTLRTLHDAGIKVGVVSNIGFDIRPHFAAWSLGGLIDAFVLSYEVGRCKPDPAFFLRACGMVGSEPERTRRTKRKSPKRTDSLRPAAGPHRVRSPPPAAAARSARRPRTR